MRACAASFARQLYVCCFHSYGFANSSSRGPSMFGGQCLALTGCDKLIQGQVSARV